MSAKQLSLHESEKVLLLAQEVKRRDVEFDEENASSLVFLLKQEGQVPFHYRFTFNPLPYSEELLDDLATLHEAGYLGVLSPIALQDKGSQWIKDNWDRLKWFADVLSKGFDKLGGFDRALLFTNAYNVATARL